ncbi:hypothetical protein NPIL_442511 [Nephila pilipes]|uniref:Uncharacterized protein n=1 Tax=Nephila pilipes TaxID=299642 RepID=A0A8X6ULQ8_NEPPI|nr:hypothetical protein NPIL_84581 [Nephila pilipes]GFU49617.1 hypothetical protein NPIL_442511 [Nephila pilipes]
MGSGPDDVHAATVCCHISAHGHLPHALSQIRCCVIMLAQVYSNNLHTLAELQQNVENAIANIPRAEQLRMAQGLINRTRRCIDVSGGHSQHVI